MSIFINIDFISLCERQKNRERRREKEVDLPLTSLLLKGVLCLGKFQARSLSFLWVCHLGDRALSTRALSTCFPSTLPLKLGTPCHKQQLNLLCLCSPLNNKNQKESQDLLQSNAL